MTPAEIAVPQLLYRYARALDRLDMGLLESLFWANARVALGNIYAGPPDGFVAVARGFMGSMAATRHVIGNVLVAAEGDRAGFEAYVDAWHLIEAPTGACVLQVAARYLGEAERRDGVWRLSQHGEVMDWADQRAADRSWFDSNAELPKGARGEADPSYAVLGGLPSLVP